MDKFLMNQAGEESSAKRGWIQGKGLKKQGGNFFLDRLFGFMLKET